jgi:hypothetical protein
MSRIIRRTTIPANASIVPVMDACHSTALRLPKTKAEFETLVAMAERDLRPTRRGRPANGTRGPKTKTRSIRAPESLWLRLEVLAKRQGLTVNQVAVQAISSLAG